MATICRPRPRRGASSVVDSRSGAPEPRAVTGSLLRSVEGAAEYSRGARRVPLDHPRRPEPDDLARRVRSRAGLARPVRRCRTRSTTTSTTTSCGRPTPSCMAASPFPTRCPRAPAGRRTGTSRTSTRSSTPMASRRAGCSSRSPRCPRSCCCRSSRPSASRRTRRRSRSGSGRSGWRSPGGCSAGCGSGPRSGRWRPWCSRPGRCGGGRPRSGARRTSPTSWPRTSRSSRWASPCAGIARPPTSAPPTRPRAGPRQPRSGGSTARASPGCAGRRCRSTARRSSWACCSASR